MKSQFYKMDYDAWDNGTMSLSVLDEGPYLRLCHQMYRAHGPIDGSANMLTSLFRIRNHNKVMAILDRLIAAGKIERLPDGRLSNSRVMQEIEDRKKLSEKRRLAGAGAHAEHPSPDGVDTESAKGFEVVSPESPDGLTQANVDKPLNLHDLPDAIAQEERREEERREESQKHAVSGVRASPPSPPPAADKPKQPRTRGTRLPADWEPSKLDLERAEFEGLNEQRIILEVTRFKNWWAQVPGQKGVKLDWPATWHNWVIKAGEDLVKERRIAARWDKSRASSKKMAV